MTDRNDSPGLSPTVALDVTRCRQITAHNIETTAVHSKSRGWLAMLKLDITHVPLVGPGKPQTLELMMSPDAVRGLLMILAYGMERAELDAEIGQKEDQ